MKNSIFYYLFVLLIVASCKEQPKDTNTEKNKADFICLEKPIDYSKCYFTREIPKDAGSIWINSWKFSAYNTIDIKLDTPVPELIFTQEKIEKLIPRDTINKGTLIYYILNDSVRENTLAKNKIPSLAMIRTDKCKPTFNDCNDHCVLVSWYNEEHTINEEFINIDSLKQYRKNWKDFLHETTKAHIEVEGYFYSWNLIMDDILENSKSQLCIRYGVRTLGPDEIDQFENPETDHDPTHEVGIPILCNIIFGMDETLYSTTEEAFAATTDHDFAKPCPAYCNE